MTVPQIWIDETAFINFIKEMYGSMAPAFSTASRFARQNGTPYNILMTSTPSDLDRDSGKFFHDTIMDMSIPFSEDFYDYYYEKGLDWLTNYVNENSQNDFVYIEYSYKQLGKDDDWLAAQKRLLNHDLALIKRELLLEWAFASSNSIFSEEELKEIKDYVIEDYPLNILLQDKYTLYLTRHPGNMAKKNYIIGIDVAGGLGRDRTAVTIIDPLSYEIVGVINSNVINATNLIDIMDELISVYFPKAVMVVELNHSGQTFVDMIFKYQSKLSKNLFYMVKEKRFERDVQVNEKLDLSRKTPKKTTKKETRVYGINTNIKTRKIMVEEILFNFINEQPHVFNNKHIFNELKTLERKKTGKIEHSDSGHDDVIFSYLVAMYAVLYEGKYMNKFLKTKHDTLSESLLTNPEEVIHKRKVSKTMNKLNNLINNDNNTDNIFSDISDKKVLNKDGDLVSINEIKDNKKSGKTNINRFKKLF